MRNGTYGKLNFLYTFKILLEHQQSFNNLLSALIDEFIAEMEIDAATAETLKQQCADVLSFSEALRIRLTDNLSLVEARTASFNFDILAWRSAGSQGKPRQHPKGAAYEYEFFLPEHQRDMLRRQLEPFNGGNVNATLRKMSEDTSADQFFYQVREVNNPSYVR